MRRFALNIRFVLTGVVTAVLVLSGPAAFCGEKQRPSNILENAISSADAASKDLSSGSMRLAEVSVGMLEKDVNLIGRNLSIEKVYNFLAQADDFISRNMTQMAGKVLNSALNEINKMRGYNKEVVGSLKNNVKNAKDAINKGVIDEAKKSIDSAGAIIDKTGVHSNYRKVEAHLAKTKAAVIEGSAEGAKNSLSALKDSLNMLGNNIVVANARINIENAIAFLQKGAVVLARKEIEKAVEGLNKIGATAGESSKGPINKVVEDLKKVSLSLSGGMKNADKSAQNALSDSLIQLEDFLEY